MNSKPAITIDMKRNCIRIYKRTLHSIDDPEYIHLLVNPEERTLAILRSDCTDPRSYRLPKARFGNKQCFEIISKSLVMSLLDLCDGWQENCSYRVYGDVASNECVVQFNLEDSFISCGTRG